MSQSLPIEHYVRTEQLALAFLHANYDAATEDLPFENGRHIFRGCPIKTPDELFTLIEDLDQTIIDMQESESVLRLRYILKEPDGKEKT